MDLKDKILLVCGVGISCALEYQKLLDLINFVEYLGYNPKTVVPAVMGVGTIAAVSLPTILLSDDIWGDLKSYKDWLFGNKQTKTTNVQNSRDTNLINNPSLLNTMVDERKIKVFSDGWYQLIRGVNEELKKDCYTDEQRNAFYNVYSEIENVFAKAEAPKEFDNLYPEEAKKEQEELQANAEELPFHSLSDADLCDLFYIAK